MHTNIIETKYYLFDQNNSGGHYVINDKVTMYVIIEAVDADHANHIAQKIGIYFDGNGDCPCCGKRWSPVRDELRYDGTPLDSMDFIDLDQMRIPKGDKRFKNEPFCIVYDLDGTVTKYNVE